MFYISIKNVYNYKVNMYANNKYIRTHAHEHAHEGLTAG